MCPVFTLHPDKKVSQCGYVYVFSQNSQIFPLIVPLQTFITRSLKKHGSVSTVYESNTRCGETRQPRANPTGQTSLGGGERVGEQRVNHWQWSSVDHCRVSWKQWKRWGLVPNRVPRFWRTKWRTFSLTKLQSIFCLFSTESRLHHSHAAATDTILCIPWCTATART